MVYWGAMRTAAVILCLACTAFAADPITFRGAFIGEPLSDYVDCSSGKAKSLKEGFKTHGKICEGKRGSVYHTQTKGVLDPKTAGESFDIENEKIIRIRIYVPREDDWEKVRYDLTQKLGNPVSEIPDVYQNGFGARWEFNQGFWVKENIVAYAGIKALPVQKVFGSGPATAGIEINITDADHAKLPSTTPSILD